MLLSAERRPRRLTEVVAGLLGALCLLGLGTAVFAGEDESTEASAETRAIAAEEKPNSAALEAAAAKAERLRRKTTPLLAAAAADRRALRSARRRLAGAEARLSSAEGEVSTLSRRLRAQEARERRSAEREQRQRERVEREEAEELPEPETTGACNPNYSGCLDPNASDYDCAGGSGDGPLYTGTVEVLGVDEYDLDRDGDGIGCDP